MRKSIKDALTLRKALSPSFAYSSPVYEEWRPVIRGLYEVSNCGHVRRNGRLLRPRLTGKPSNAYYTLGSSIDGRKRNFRVHRLVAEAFLGTCPCGMEVNHKDLNKFNNCIANLEYVTRSQNVRHAISRLGTWQVNPNRRANAG